MDLFLKRNEYGREQSVNLYSLYILPSHLFLHAISSFPAILYCPPHESPLSSFSHPHPLLSSFSTASPSHPMNLFPRDGEKRSQLQ